MRERRVLIGGLPYFGRMLAGMLDGGGWRCRYLESAGRSPRSWLASARAIAASDLVYLIGGQLERWSRPDWVVRFGQRPVVMHWVGSDVGFARGTTDRGLASRPLMTTPTHWAETPWTAAELRSMGIEAEVVPLTSTRMPTEAPPLPDDFAVLTYLPSARPEFYGRSSVMRLAAALHDAQVLVAGSDGRGWPAPPNVEFLGWRSDMEPVYARSSVLLRQPEHDGLSFMVLEALAAGRHVIWNHPLEGVIEAPDEETALAELRRLFELHRRAELQINHAGRAAVVRRFAVDRVRSEVLGRFQRLL